MVDIKEGQKVAVSAKRGKVGRGEKSRPEWYYRISKFEKPDHRKAIGQVLNTLIPYCVLWCFMVLTRTRGYPYWVTLLLAIPAAGFLVRVFTFFHDCCHGSFLAGKKANTILGYLFGILVFTPFYDWQYTHWRHHATVANLDYRGEGDVWTMTLEEYLRAPKHQKWLYRLFRNPLILFGFGPLFYFVVRERFPSKGVGRKERKSVAITNLAILGIVATAAWTIGFSTYILIQLPVLHLAAATGVWLFYVQHQFEGVYWARRENWDAMKAAIEGSSFYKLPRVLQWFSGSIGLHYIHHVRPRIPNYNLQTCYDDTPELQTVPALTPLQSLRSLRLRLWDETREQLVGFRALRYYLNNKLPHG
jgi:omega-6 fatty acid desaturase (delta-12 desaturase)